MSFTNQTTAWERDVDMLRRDRNKLDAQIDGTKHAIHILPESWTSQLRLHKQLSELLKLRESFRRGQR